MFISNHNGRLLIFLRFFKEDLLNAIIWRFFKTDLIDSSEELNNAKQEYLLALQKKETLGNSVIHFDDVIDAAKNKLLLWDMSEQQIRNINKSDLANSKTTFSSTASGYITQLNLQEGDYVSEGGSIVKLAGFSTLWVEAQVYATQLAQLNNAKNVMVEIQDIPGKKFPGKISFRNPELNSTTRSILSGFLLQMKGINLNHECPLILL